MNEWLYNAVASIDSASQQAAEQHQLHLTKPAGSLGQLESIATQFAGWQSNAMPNLQYIEVAIFAGDHGVCAQNVSAFPQAVTGQMVINFLEGGAAISVLSESLGAHLQVVNMGLATPLPKQYLTHANYRHFPINPGTNDFSLGPAMTEEQVLCALFVGKSIVAQTLAARQDKPQLWIGGEMGIGNTTAASALYSILLGLPPAQTVGAGTGVDQAGIDNKIRVIEQTLTLYGEALNGPLALLRFVGGFEIAGLTGSYIACAQAGIPCLVDGFIATVAALLAVNINPNVRQWLLFSHQSAEPAHRLALEALDAKPLLDLGLRLGEGSGAAIAVPIIQSALLLHNKMATFAQANVSARRED